MINSLILMGVTVEEGLKVVMGISVAFVIAFAITVTQDSRR